MTSRIMPPMNWQPWRVNRLLEQLSDRGIDTEKLTLMVLLDALGSAGLSLEQSTEASRAFLDLSAPKEFNDFLASWKSFGKKQEGAE